MPLYPLSPLVPLCWGEKRDTHREQGHGDMGIREHGEFRDRGREIWGLGDEQNGAMGIQGQWDGGENRVKKK